MGGVLGSFIRPVGLAGVSGLGQEKSQGCLLGRKNCHGHNS